MKFLILALLCLAPLAASAADKELNQIAIHYKYNDGDFPAVISAIEQFTKSHKKYDRNDSVFIAKHLAVVYSASPETREKGKYYMYQLLELLPSAELVDMYVSDEIEKIFDRIRLDVAERHKEMAAPSTASATPTATVAESGERGRYWKKPWVWAGGAVVAGVAGFVIYETMSPNPKGRPEYVVP
ncbi:MAG: hypothetical protein JWO30_4494 [Fibrobacteres bacterium]|nr:hypothetical protein [Fibrobacterota bacterium]